MKNFTYRTASASRLDELLRLQLPQFLNTEISNSKIRRLIVAGAVCVNGRECRVPGFNVKGGSLVTAFVEEEKLFFEKDAGDVAFELTEKDVLFEDEDVIVVNKPAFFPTEAGMVKSRDNLHAAVVRYLHGKQPSLRNPPYAGIMHRLDRETSGAILFTKNRKVNGPCHDMFEQHTARKIYRAVVCAGSNELKPGDRFTVQGNMNRISAKSQAAKWGLVKSEGLWSKTDFTVLKEKNLKGIKCYLVECRLETGRTHQIRVHLSSRGLPILGDELYGGKKYERILLHAESLTFPHPVSGEIIKVQAPLPEQMQ